MGNKEVEKRYIDYAETIPIDDPQIWRAYQALRASVAHLPKADQVEILERAADLANAHEKAAFMAAAQLHIRK